MAGHYSPKHFLRQVPKPLLKTFFDRRGELQEIQWSEAGEMDVDPIFEAWQDLPEASRNDVERWFRAVAELATPEGLQTLIEEGQFHRVDLTVCLGQLKDSGHADVGLRVRGSAIFRWLASTTTARET